MPPTHQNFGRDECPNATPPNYRAVLPISIWVYNTRVLDITLIIVSVFRGRSGEHRRGCQRFSGRVPRIRAGGPRPRCPGRLFEPLWRDGKRSDRDADDRFQLPDVPHPAAHSRAHGRPLNDVNISNIISCTFVFPRHLLHLYNPHQILIVRICEEITRFYQVLPVCFRFFFFFFHEFILHTFYT